LKFKVDENLPTEYASVLRGAGFEADTVSDEKLSGASDSVLSERCCEEDRVLMTLDFDFANVQASAVEILTLDFFIHCLQHYDIGFGSKINAADGKPSSEFYIAQGD
jgi:hypothetical protein